MIEQEGLELGAARIGHGEEHGFEGVHLENWRPAGRCASLSRMRRLAKRVARSLGVDLSRATPNLFDFMASRGIDIVLDVGANIGQFGAYLRRGGYAGEIISFEPSAADYAVLAAAVARDGRWTAHNFALGAVAGRMMLNISTYTVFNSLLDITQAADRFDGRSAPIRREEVDVKLLDGVVAAACRGHSVMLKVDTQGFERQVLDGAPSTLAMASGVLLELPIVHLYQDTWSLSQAVDYMAAAGFEIAQLRAVNFDSRDRVSMVDVDCLFRRAQEAARRK